MWKEVWRGRVVWSPLFGGDRTVVGLAPGNEQIYVGDDDGTYSVPLEKLWDRKTMWPLYAYNSRRHHRRGGRLRSEHWSISHMGGDSHVAERTVDGKYESREVSAHCKACAKVEILAKYGGTVDLRGWQRAGECGFFLKVMVVAMKEGEVDE